MLLSKVGWFNWSMSCNWIPCNRLIHCRVREDDKDTKEWSCFGWQFAHTLPLTLVIWQTTFWVSVVWYICIGSGIPASSGIYYTTDTLKSRLCIHAWTKHFNLTPHLWPFCLNQHPIEKNNLKISILNSGQWVWVIHVNCIDSLCQKGTLFSQAAISLTDILVTWTGASLEYEHDEASVKKRCFLKECLDWLHEPWTPHCNTQLQTSFSKPKDSFMYPILDCVLQLGIS